MAHTLSITIPTKEEVKEKTSAFWNKHKRTIVAGGAVVGGGVLYAYLNKDSENADQYSIDANDALVLDGPVAHESEDGVIVADVYIGPDETEYVIDREESTTIEENE